MMRRVREPGEFHLSRWNVDQLVPPLDEEVVVIGDVRIEVRLRSVDGHLPEQPELGELM